MRTIRLPTVLEEGGRGPCTGWLGGGESLYSEVQVEQVWTSLGGGTCIGRSDASWVIVTWDPPLWTNRRTDTTENIIFPQLSWRAVVKFFYNVYHSQKNTSRHGGKPLKVLVMHTAVVAHQIFAQKILSWLYTILGHSGMSNDVSFMFRSK